MFYTHWHNIRGKYYKTSACKRCTNEATKIYVAANKEKVAKRKKDWCVNNKERNAETKKKWREKNIVRLKERAHDSYIRNREQRIAASNLWRKNNLKLCNIYYKKYRDNNKEKVKKSASKYWANNKEKIRNKARSYQKQWYMDNKVEAKRRSLIPITELKEEYVRQKIGLLKAECPPELIEAKRAQLKLYRATK